MKNWMWSAIVVMVACSSSSTPPSADGGTSTSSGGTSSGGTSSGATSSGADSGGTTVGCADGGVCSPGQQCCTGVPYAEEGECLPVCDAKSDRNAKERFEVVDGEEVLARVSRVPVSRWSYRQQPGVRHIGPMAQDFNATFEVGADERIIHGVDANGVTLVAIQALDRHVRALERDVAALREENARLADRCEKSSPRR